jgi:hypothetical protein
VVTVWVEPNGGLPFFSLFFRGYCLFPKFWVYTMLPQPRAFFPGEMDR